MRHILAAFAVVDAIAVAVGAADVVVIVVAEAFAQVGAEVVVEVQGSRLSLLLLLSANS